MADLQELQQAHEDLYASYEQLVADLDGEDWDRETGCPGWAVRDIVAHVIGVEAAMAGDPEPAHDLPDDLPHVRNDMGRYMEMHVDVRRQVPVRDLVDELGEVLARRRSGVAALDDVGQEIPSVMGTAAPAAPVLTVRVLDLWMHDQDLRRALGRPGHRSGPAVDVALRRLARGLVRELPGRLEGAGGAVVIEVAGESPLTLAVDLGAGEQLDAPPTDPAVTVRMDLDAFAALTGGRDDAPSPDQLEIEGDEELGRRLVAVLAITP